MEFRRIPWGAAGSSRRFQMISVAFQGVSRGLSSVLGCFQAFQGRLKNVLLGFHRRSRAYHLVFMAFREAFSGVQGIFKRLKG